MSTLTPWPGLPLIGPPFVYADAGGRWSSAPRGLRVCALRQTAG